jgi:methyl-accepting chemotaxis protein
MDIQTIMLAFAVVTGLAVLLQTVFLLAILVSMRKTSKTILSEVESLRSAIMPVVLDSRDLIASSRETLAGAQEFVTSAQGFLARVSPKIEAATSDLAEITHGLRTQTMQMQSSAQEIVGRLQKQSERVDYMITGFLDTVDRAGGFVSNVVSKPVQQISNILRAVKAIVESLRTPPPPRRPAPPAGDDRFV